MVGRESGSGDRFSSFTWAAAWVTGLVGAVTEAWAELRIHRTRVLLSLIGVAVAVCALTTVVGFGSIVQQSTTESFERSSGRPAILSINFSTQAGDPVMGTPTASKVREVAERYHVDYWTTNGYDSFPVQFADGAREVNAQVVDADFGVIHRVQLTTGRWLSDADEQRLAPALVVNDAFYTQLGSPDIRTHPTVTLLGKGELTAVVVGVEESSGQPNPSMYLLSSAYLRQASSERIAQYSPQFELWVPPAKSKQLSALITRDLKSTAQDGVVAQVNRQDYLAWGNQDPLLPVKLVLGGVSVLILFLGALGLVNISLVTVRQRIREIGIRRSFGATAGRVFFAVMMESVVATLAAGVVGVLASILIVQNPWLRDEISQGATDLPPFPIEAALIGIAAAAVIGALAGLLPAVVAVRVKVIDAIRY